MTAVVVAVIVFFKLVKLTPRVSPQLAMEGGGDQSNRVTPSTSDAVIAAADRLLLAAHAGDVDAVRCWTSLTTAAAARGVWAPPQGAGDLAGLAADRRAAAGAA